MNHCAPQSDATVRDSVALEVLSESSRSLGEASHQGLKSTRQGMKVSGIKGEGDLLEPIAIIGLSMKFPQDAVSIESFWQMMLDRRSSLVRFPKNRLNIDAFYDPEPARLGTVMSHDWHLPVGVS